MMKMDQIIVMTEPFMEQYESIKGVGKGWIKNQSILGPKWS